MSYTSPFPDVDIPESDVVDFLPAASGAPMAVATACEPHVTTNAPARVDGHEHHSSRWLLVAV